MSAEEFDSSLNDLLASMPDVGEDSDFERSPDRGRVVDVPVLPG